ncbi:MAG: UDP-N-acetylmuramoyl-tripeptide--D-alanyl-D-alanine ligase [Thioalkalispiraceae bacterium]|jgi:UDP-N-acetylmuramoyl-tripeptide--D-alanyl-D-alanine ligase
MVYKPFKWNLSKIVNAVQGRLLGNDIVVNGVTTDSRVAKPGELFIALQGPNFDGHDYVEMAAGKGVAAIIVSRELPTSLPQIIVEDTRLALGQLANAWRMQFSIPVIAITGSNGKTTVKELTTSILSQTHNVLATKGNLNNDIGVPLTLLQLGSDHSAAVIEMGANHQKEIEYLTHLAKPTVAVITNAGPAHLEGFGDLDGVAKAKGEIYSSLTSEGTAIINKDDKYFSYWQSLCAGMNISTFGIKSEADFSADKRDQTVVISTPDGEVTVNYPLPGEHNLLNALAASAACRAVGANLNDIKNGLEQMHGVSGRLELKKGKSGSQIIDDTYNANPASLKVALQVLSEYPGTHYLALGDMGELGVGAEELHSDAGEQARRSGVDKLYAIGKYAKFSANSFGEQGFAFEDQPSMISEIESQLSNNVTLLVKGSRLMKMENIVNALAANEEN